jgi:hypothetical protein
MSTKSGPHPAWAKIDVRTSKLAFSPPTAAADNFTPTIQWIRRIFALSAETRR